MPTRSCIAQNRWLGHHHDFKSMGVVVDQKVRLCFKYYPWLHKLNGGVIAQGSEGTVKET
jgi:hypothetical protein